MCGIAGVYNKNCQNNKRQLYKMLRTMRYRGPDGTVTHNTNNISLGLVRLAMNDIKSKASVFSNENKDIFCVFNGEIYNSEILRKQLESEGHFINTKNDGDIITHLYEKYGKKFVSYLDGMFSIAILDNKRVLIFTDRFGIKPIYYTKSDCCFIFSSEIRPILAVTNKHKISETGLASYLQYRFIAHPFTIFNDIYKMGPGEILEFCEGKLKISKYKTVKQKSLFNTKLSENIKFYESNEVEIGTFLSGGLDSSILNCILSKPCHAFTIKYENSPNTDESRYAKLIADNKSLQYHLITLKDKDVLFNLNKSVLYLEEPLYSTVSVSTYYLAKNARKYIKGVICGDGADEIFLGYNYIRTALSNRNKEISTYKEQISWLKDEIKQNIFAKFPNDKYLNLIKNNPNILEEITNFERYYRLPNYHLSRLDKLTMANSIEGRVPYLSNSTIDYANKYTYEELLTEPAKKLLIDEFSKILPQTILERPKQPFTTPFIKWIDGCLYSDILKTFQNKKLCKFMNIYSDELVKLLTSNKKTYFDYTAIWGLYMLLKWLTYYKIYISK